MIVQTTRDRLKYLLQDRIKKYLRPLNSHKLKVVGAEISGPAITHDHCTYDSGHVTVVRN